MRATLIAATIAVFVVLTAGALTQQLPLRHDLEVLASGPMRIDTVKDGLYVIRGPFLPCGTRGCTPNGSDDGLIHEPGDVAVRVTPEGVILVDDKYPENVADVLARVKTITSQPVRYLLNSHHHGDHVSGNANVRQLGVDIIAHRNIRENFLRIKQPGEPNITFADQAAVHLGGVEVQLFHLGRGHTNGDTVIYFPDLKTIHMGDLVIDGMPVIDYAGGGSAYRVRFETLNQRMRELARRKVPKTQIATLEQARAQLKLADLGWDNSVSTTAWLRNIGRHYDEMALAR